MRNPPKRNMKTKSAVLPRKEPSSSMRQYLYLRAGEKGGLQYRKLTAGHPVPTAGLPSNKLLQAQPRAEQCKLHLTPLTPWTERGPCCASARAHPRNGHCSPARATAAALPASLWAGSALQQAQMEGQEGLQFKRAKGRTHSPRVLPRQAMLGRKMDGGSCI